MFLPILMNVVGLSVHFLRERRPRCQSIRPRLKRSIGERVAVTVAAGDVRIRHGMREVAVHKQSEGRRLRIIGSAHLDGVAGRTGAFCRPAIATPTVPAPSPLPSLLRPLAEYEAAIGGSF